MANGAQQAVDNATRLSEIGFPEFTAKLITDTFDGITSSYLRQMAQYLRLVQVVGQTLADFINDTAGDVSAEDIGAFVLNVGGVNDVARNFLLGDTAVPGRLDAAEAKALTDALALPPAAVATPGAADPASPGALDVAKRQTIVTAAARRIAASRYDFLQTMVRQGVLRLYVDSGTIETRLTFSTFGQSRRASSSGTLRSQIETKASVEGGAKLNLGGKIGSFFRGSSAGNEAVQGGSTITVSAAKESQRDVSGSRVQIFGRVKLNFKTDFLPLAAPEA